MNSFDIKYVVVSRSDLARALRGEKPAAVLDFSLSFTPRLSSREALVLWSRNSKRPCLVCVSEEDKQELFNWAVTFQSDISPLSSWCHVLSMRDLQRLDENMRLDAELLGLEAAWAGASVAEAMILSRRNFDVVSLPACLATDTFAIARTAALYGAKGTLLETIERLDVVRDKLRRASSKWRPTTSLAISALIRLLPNAPPTQTRLQDILVKACAELHSQAEVPEPLSATVVSEIGKIVPKLSVLSSIVEMSAEDRVKLLREIRIWIAATSVEDERGLLLFAAGYVMSRIGGAERDLRLAEAFEADYPHVLTWATVLGGLGATTYWSDAFGGIGRLVARELCRSIHFEEAPSADVSADELLVIAAHERGVNKLRTAQRTVATISVRPGVNVQLGISDDERSARGDEAPRQALNRSPTIAEASTERQVEALAERLFPYLQSMLIRAGFSSSAAIKERKRGRSQQLTFPDKSR